MLAAGCRGCSSAPLPAGGTRLPEPRFPSDGRFSVPACVLAPWKSCRGGGLALAVRRLSCARHPLRPPTAAPVVALAGVCYLQRGFVLVLQPESSACAWEPAAAAWEGVCGHGVVFISLRWSAVTLAPRTRAPLLLCSLHRCVCAASSCLCAELRGPRAGCQGREQRAAPARSKPPLPQHPLCLSQLPPPAASPSPRWARAKCPCCHCAHILAVVPSTPGAVPPCAPQQSPFCWGQSRAGGDWAGTCPPNTNQEGERVYPGSWGGTAGSALQDPPTSRGDREEEGEGRPRGRPREQRVSVARDSSKETRGDKCATNRWGGYLGKDAARWAGGQPPPRRAGRRRGAGAGTPRLGGGLQWGQAEAGLHALAPLSPWGQHPYGRRKGVSGVCAGCPRRGSGTAVQGAASCLLALPLLPSS